MGSKGGKNVSPCHLCSPPAPASHGTMARQPAPEGWFEERGHPLASSQHPRWQKLLAVAAGLADARAAPCMEPDGWRSYAGCQRVPA